MSSRYHLESGTFRNIWSQATVGISTLNNVDALRMCLTSLLTGSMLPGRLQLRFEGDVPGFADYYVEQLAAFCRLLGVEFNLTVQPTKGIFYTRQWQLENCCTEFLILLDDDCIVFPDAIQALREVAFYLDRDRVSGPDWAWLQGSKADLNNRRGYGNFSTQVHGSNLCADSSVRNNCNLFWDPRQNHNVVPVKVADVGFGLLNRLVVLEKGVGFLHNDLYTNAGGEDTLFALACAKADLSLFFTPKAGAIHLEKPRSLVRLSEHAYRKQLVLREAQLAGYPTDAIKDCVLPWEPLHDFSQERKPRTSTEAIS